MKLPLLAPVFLAALAAAVPASAQVTLEVRGGGAFGNHAPAYSGMGTTPGLSLTGVIEMRAVPLASVYGTYVRASFGCTDGLCAERDVTVTTQGYGGGVRIHPAGLPWVRAGALLYDATVESSTGSETALPGIGYEAAGGLTVSIGRSLRLLPGVYYRTQAGDDRTTLIGADVGLQISF